MQAQAPKNIFWIACFSFIAIGIQGSALNVAWLYMQDSFGKSLDAIGIVLLAGTVGGLAVSFLSGHILRFLSIGWVCLVATCFEVIALVIISITPHWAIFVAAALILGLGRSGINVAMNTFVAEHYSAGRMNLLHAIYGIGATAGPLLVTFIVVNLASDWQLAYGMITIIQVIVAGLFILTLKHWSLDEKEHDSQQIVRATYLATLKLLPMWAGLALLSCHVGFQMSMGQLMNNLLVEGRSVDAGLAGLWISLFWGFLTVGRMIFAALTDRFGAPTILRYCTLGSILGVIAIWLNLTTSLSFAGLALVGFSLAPVFPSSVSRTPALVGKAHSPNAIGFQMAGAGLGGALIPGLVAYIADNTTLEAIPPALVVIALAQFFIHEWLSFFERNKEG